MTDTAKPTPGPWDVQEHGLNERLIPFSIFGNLSSEKKNWVLIAKLYSTGPLGADCSERNAALIAEAGTVYHETNLTPRQLLERYNKLYQAATFLCADLLDRHQEGGEAWDNMQDFFIKTTLAKHGEGV